MLARMRDWLGHSSNTTDTWTIPPLWKRAAVGLAVLVLLVQIARLVVHPRGDFDVHRESGRRMAAGESLYARQSGQDKLGHNYPYPPFWALVHAPFSFLPILTGQLILYPLFLVSAVVLVKTLNRLLNRHEPLSEDGLFFVVVGAIFLSSRFLVRDMPECGVNLALVALSWLAVACWVHRRDWAGGWCLGLAISLKCTPALFWAWFVWKRQWKIAGATLLAVFVFTLSPILVMGPQSYAATMTEWMQHIWRGVGETHPAYGVLGDEPLQNVSLRPALARFFTVLPAGHRSRIDHPWYVDGLDLSPLLAGGLIKLFMLGLVLGTAWSFRRSVEERDNPTWFWETAAVSVLILLLSPITWGQHCVGVFPACYLLMRRRVSGKHLPAWTRAVLWTYIAGLIVLNRELAGRELTYLMDSYRLPTLFLLGLFAVTCRMRSLVSEEHPAVKGEADSISLQQPPASLHRQSA